MANIEVKLRRGTDTEHSSFTGAEGEVTVDTTNDTLRVHDGSTAGGIRLAKLSEVSGGTGTVTSVDSGTGLTGGPITTSGTLSLASIANSTVLGNVSGASAAPVAVDIKDEDAMTSNSDTALATQQSIKAYVDAQVAASTVSKYSTGWQNSIDAVTVANGSTHTITHNLGTDDVTVQVFVATSSAGANSYLISSSGEFGSSGTVGYGAQINTLSTNTFELQLGSGGYFEVTTLGNINTGTSISFASKYIKVVVIG